jgi:hypothetical protein
MANAEQTGSELKERLNRWNDGKHYRERVTGVDIALALGIGAAVVSHAFKDYNYPAATNARRHIAEYLTSLEQGKKPLPNRMHAKPMVTR